jgi:hypothetical protein
VADLDDAPRPERIRRLTTLAVTVALVLGLGCLVTALALGLPPGGLVVALGALPGALTRLEPPALASAGVLLLLAAPLMRLVGLVVGFWHDRDRAALAAGVTMLVLLALTFVVARAR